MGSVAKENNTLLLVTVLLAGLAVNAVVLSGDAVSILGAISTATPSGSTDVLNTTQEEMTVPDRTADSDSPASDTASANVGLTVVPRTLSAEQKGSLATVIEVLEGNKIRVRYENGEVSVVRLTGVDVPNKHFDEGTWAGLPSTAEGIQCIRRWRNEAKNFTRSKLLNKQISLVYDEGDDREVALVSLNNTIVNYDLIIRGYARVSEYDFHLKSKFKNAESASRNMATGVWGC